MELIDNVKYKASAWAAIISAVTLFPMFILGFMLGIFPDNKIIALLVFIGTGFSIIISIPIIIGYIRLAQKCKSKYLEIMAYAIFIAGILFSMYDMVKFAFFKDLYPWIDFLLLFLLGIMMIIFGISIFDMKKKFGSLITILGILYIVDGVFYMTIILILLVPFTATAVSIIEAIMFFKASKKYDK